MILTLMRAQQSVKSAVNHYMVRTNMDMFLASGFIFFVNINYRESFTITTVQIVERHLPKNLREMFVKQSMVSYHINLLAHFVKEVS